MKHSKTSDDFSINYGDRISVKSYPQNGALDDVDLYFREKNNQTIVVKPEQPDKKRFKFWQYLTKPFKKIGQSINWTTNTKLGKILTGNLFLTGISIAFAAPLLFTPLAPVTIAIAALSVTSIVINTCSTIYKTRKIRKLQQEHNLLVQNQVALNKRDTLLAANPDLSIILTGKLYDQKNTTHKKHYSTNHATEVIANTILNNASYAALKIINAVPSIATGNIPYLIENGAILTGFIGLTAYSESSYTNLVATFKDSINKHNENPKIGGYKNIWQLKEVTRQQRIEAMVLEGLINDPAYGNMTIKEKKQKFEDLKVEISDREEKIRKGHSIFSGFSSVAKDFARTMNPFYKKPVITDAKLPEKLPDTTTARTLKVEDLKLPKSVTTYMQKNFNPQINSEIHEPPIIISQDKRDANNQKKI